MGIERNVKACRPRAARRRLDQQRQERALCVPQPERARQPQPQRGLSLFLKLSGLNVADAANQAMDQMSRPAASLCNDCETANCKAPGALVADSVDADSRRPAGLPTYAWPTCGKPPC